MKNKVLFYLPKSKGESEHFVLFSNPEKEIICFKRNSIKSTLLLLSEYVKKGYFVAGFICYETGCIFNDIIPENQNLPYFYFGIYKNFKIIKNLPKIENKDKFVLYDLNENVDFNEYKTNVKKIRDFLKNGEVYQINYCFKKKFKFAGDSFALFNELLKNQKTKYGVFFELGDYRFLSLSPELFFSIENGKITMKPMKGTIIKGGSENLSNIKDEKNLAENIMIVDLIRNDMGKICKINSIKTPKKFTVERYKTLYQMTSTITGKLRKKVKFIDIVYALFPSGSVTGAPKRRAMQIIKLLEKEQRGIYTGTIGFFSKDKAMFNVCIRTPIINTKTGEGEIGIGSGVVYDSKPEKEYKECQGKANFFISLAEDFRIFESMLYNRDNGFFLLNLHIHRLKNACKKFGFRFDEKKIRKTLTTCTKKIKTSENFKVRIFTTPDGGLNADYSKIQANNRDIKICFADERVDSSNIFLYYKTNKREFYERNLKKVKEKGYDEVVFFNEKGELTECSYSNIFIEKNGIFYTPPIKCGLLNGIYRQYLLKKFPLKYKEKVLYKKDLINADNIFICNSVRGMRRAVA
ncbi:MAG: bifunctional anthranilate synthase component I family protein/aminotransferase class IV [Candidatus Goldbacteria bacterium]|nr:bifunctional anthranilate synthase component I family protein/aminotransferase class IV [Candidatus Goldiibacteriota bacterium]